MVADHGRCDHNLRKDIKMIVKLLMLFPIIIYKMVKAGGYTSGYTSSYSR